MKTSLRICAAAWLCLFGIAPALQADDAPSITILHAGSNRLKEDIKFILSLTNAAEQKQWKVIEEHLDEVFLLGIDGARPLRIDMISQNNKMETRTSFPISKKDDFLENLNLFGIDLKRKTSTYYELKNAYEGHMRLIDGYAVIAAVRELVPARNFKPLDDETLKKYFLDKDGKMRIPGVGFLLLNENGKPADRRKSFEEVKKELMAAISQAEDESKEDFDLRRAMTELQLDELARYYADPKEVLISGTLDHQAKVGKVTLDLLPDKNTDLAGAVATVATKPSYFASQTAPENQILSATINLPLDPSQQTNASKVIKLQLERGFAHVDADKEATDEQKAAVKKAMSLAGDAIETTLKEHGLDGFAYCKPNPSGKHTMLGGLVMSKPENLTELFNLMPSFPRPRKIAMDIEKQGEVAIHEFEFSEASQAAMLDFFGAGKMYVGVGPKVAWFALGDNALADLKAAIEATSAASEQAPTPQFFSFSIKGAPWIGWHDRHDKQPAPALKKTIKQVAGTNGEEKPDTRQKLSSIPIRQLAIEAFDEGNDVLSLSLRKDDDRIKGDLKADTGLLRFIGKALASFSKDTLEE